MSDRVCMMTSGPNAKVGKLLSLPFGRPRNRAEVLEHPEYYELRGSCLLYTSPSPRDATLSRMPSSA